MKLIPDDVGAPNKLLDQGSADQARAYLLQVSTPALDNFRTQMKAIKTSELLSLMANPELVTNALGFTEEAFTTAQQEAFMAALLAVADEIDRRIPIP